MTLSSRPQTQRPPLEKDVQKGVVQLFRACGGIVYSTSQGYRKEKGGTRCTPGIPDLWIFFPRNYGTLWWETKRPGGRRTSEQVAFATQCKECYMPYGYGGV